MAKSQTRKLNIVVAVRDQTKTALTGIKSGVKKFAAGVANVGKKIAGAISMAFKAVIAAATVALALLLREVKRQFEEIDRLAKTAVRFGVAVENIRALELAGKLAGVELSQLTTILRDTSRRVSEAAQGTGEAQEALKELGLSARDLNKLSVDRQFDVIMSKLAEVENANDRVRIAYDIMGRSGTQALTMLGKSLQSAKLEAELLGVELDQTGAQAIQDANDEVTRMQTAFKGIAQTIAIGIAPAVERVANIIKDTLIQIRLATSSVDTIRLSLEEGFVSFSIVAIEMVQKIGTAFARAMTDPINAAISTINELTGSQFALLEARRNAYLDEVSAALGQELESIRAQLDAQARLRGSLQNGLQLSPDPEGGGVGRTPPGQPGIVEGRLLTGQSQSSAQMIADVQREADRKRQAEAKRAMEQREKTNQLLEQAINNPNNGLGGLLAR